MICPKCQSEMVERVTAFQCPNFEENKCEQPPVCKGCYAAQEGPVPGIGEYFCNNDECPRWIFPKVTFSRMALRDSGDLYDMLFNLYSKGSLPVDIILEFLNIDPEDCKAGAE